jgi:hypothetical protein
MTDKTENIWKGTAFGCEWTRKATKETSIRIDGVPAGILSEFQNIFLEC